MMCKYYMTHSYVHCHIITSMTKTCFVVIDTYTIHIYFNNFPLKVDQSPASLVIPKVSANSTRALAPANRLSTTPHELAAAAFPEFPELLLSC